LVAGLACVSLLAACGTRMSHDAVVSGVDGRTVHLAQDSVDQLKKAAAPAAPVAAPVPGAAAVAPGAPTSTVAVGPAQPTSKLAAPAAPSTGKNKTTPAVVPATPSCAHPLDPVNIGQIGTFSGVAGPITGPARSALAVWVRDLNTRGGLACHPVQLYSADDGGDSGKAAAEEQDLVRSHHVVAFVGTVLPFSIAGFRPAVERDKIPVIGGTSATPDFYDSPWFFPDAASVDDQAIGLIRNGVNRGHKTLGLLYCVEVSACTQLQKKGKEFAKAGGADLVYDAPISVTQPDFTAQCINARNAKVDLLGAAMDGASMNRLARSCQAIGYKPLLATAGGLLTPAQSADSVLRSFGVVTVSGEAPWILDDKPGLKAYRAALAMYTPDTAPDGASAMAWTAGELLRAAVEHVDTEARSGPITTALIMRGLGMISHETLGGLAAPFSFSPNQPHATSSGCMFFELLTTAGWSAPQGSKPVCVR